MFEIAIAIGIFSYLIFLLGLVGFLYPLVLVPLTLLFWITFVFLQRKSITSFLKSLSFRNLFPLFLIGIAYLVVQAIVNSIGLFGPEIGFDAMWYHLTLPKLYLLYHMVVHIPGGVLYYSDMPRLTEMLFTAGLSFGSDFFARLVQFLFGILTLFVLYKIGRKFLSPVWALLLPIVFYSNLVVGWESISGYIDLSRTFFTTIALLAFLEWIEKKEQKFFIFSALFVGLSISTKLLALPDLGIYTLALLWFEKNSLSILQRLKRVGIFIGIALLCPLPWFAFAFIHTGDPFFPMLSSTYLVPGYWQILNPLFLLESLWNTFAQASDPINPLFLALLPFFILYGKKLWKEVPLLVIFSLGGLIAWYITPQTGGGRYILPYLSVLSLFSVCLIQKLSVRWRKIFVCFIILVACISLLYRAVANAKFIPVILHKESKAHFMSNHLQFQLGDFYDIDGYFANHIKPTDTVLLIGFHNLYYVNFPFIHESWAQKNATFTYVAIQGDGLPKRFAHWNLVYYNNKTLVRLYKLDGGIWRF